MEKLYTSKTFLKMAGGRMHTPHSTLWPYATETIKRVWRIQSLSTISFVLFY